MPEYTAYCPKCDREEDYFASVSARDAKLAEVRQCCGVPLRRKMYAPAVDVVFQPGNYDIGLGGPKYYGNQREMERDVAKFNKTHADKEGGREINLVREK